MTLPARGADTLFAAFVPMLPLTLAVFVGYFAMGMAMAAVPLQLHGPLGQGPLLVGVVMGAQYASAMFARMWAGTAVDTRGARRGAAAGLLGASLVGGLYGLSAATSAQPALATGILLAARLATGVAEAFFMTAMLAWGIRRMGPQHAGKVIGWVGMALFGAYAAGAPVGALVLQQGGFGGVALAQVLVPLAALGLVLAIPAVPSTAQARLPFTRVIGAIRLPGLGLTLSSAGFAMVTAFGTLLFVQRGWGAPALAFACQGLGFILARLLFGHLPDRGGARVALPCVLAAALGQALIWAAPAPALAALGAALTGGGYALAFQAFGVEAVRRTPPESRGAAMGAYVAFQDIAMLASAPLGGALAQAAGLENVFLAAAVAAVLAAGVAWRMQEGSGSEPARE